MNTEIGEFHIEYVFNIFPRIILILLCSNFRASKVAESHGRRFAFKSIVRDESLAFNGAGFADQT